jgi:GTP-dependent dephospho-CoA kinase
MQIRPRPEDLEKMKAPLGILLTGPPSEAIPKLQQLIKLKKPPMVATVGDIVSQETLKARLKIDLRIVDNKTLRNAIRSIDFPSQKTYTVRNPAGVIRSEAWQTIKKAVGRKGSLVIVEGEEDLLVLPVLLEAPEDSLVVYGQPREGIVVVEATASKKREVKAMVDRMSQEIVRE